MTVVVKIEAKVEVFLSSTRNDEVYELDERYGRPLTRHLICKVSFESFGNGKPRFTARKPSTLI